MAGPSRRPLIAATAAVLVAVVALVVVVLAVDGSSSDDPPAATTTASTTSITTTVATTTTPPIEHEPLAPGVREVVTVRSGIDDVFVQQRPPAGWDDTLSPVVTSSAPQPPRSALDLQRTPLPSSEVPISGRHVAEGGWRFSNPTTFSPPQPLVFGVVERQGEWIQVLVPVRPNGTTGWLRAELVTLSSTDLSVEVSLTERRVRVVRAGVEQLSAPIAIGAPSTPTPTGAFYVTDIVPSVNPAGGYGPVALALNGYSEVMDSFGGESDVGVGGADAPDAVAPVLALHGTNQPDSVGQALSNGCPRLYNDDVVRLAELVPAGTPVNIWP